MDIPPEYADRISVSDDGCWNWTGWVVGLHHKTSGNAVYGVLQRNTKRMHAHRYFYELATGDAPGERCVHHKCRNTLCVNPDHLEAVHRSDHNHYHNTTTHQANLANLAREACRYGHSWTEASTYWWKGRVRQCRICTKEAMRRWRKVRGLEGKHEIKTACPQGHPYSGGNLRITPNGWRLCRECNRVRSREAQRKKARLKRESA